jgi:hypothetical protein
MAMQKKKNKLVSEDNDILAVIVYTLIIGLMVGALIGLMIGDLGFAGKLSDTISKVTTLAVQEGTNFNVTEQVRCVIQDIMFICYK